MKILRNNTGSASLLFMTCVGGLALALYYRELIESSLDPAMFFIFSLILTIGAIFSAGSFASLLVQGQALGSAGRGEIEKRLDELSEFIIKANQRINTVQSLLPSNRITLSPKGLDSLGMARSIVMAMTERCAEAESLVFTKDSIDLIDAYEILDSNLSGKKNAMETVITAPDLPETNLDEAMEQVESLLSIVDEETVVVDGGEVPMEEVNVRVG